MHLEWHTPGSGRAFSRPGNLFLF